jgi:hypothetical protein
MIKLNMEVYHSPKTSEVFTCHKCQKAIKGERNKDYFILHEVYCYRCINPQKKYSILNSSPNFLRTRVTFSSKDNKPKLLTDMKIPEEHGSENQSPNEPKSKNYSPIMKRCKSPNIMTKKTKLERRKESIRKDLHKMVKDSLNKDQSRDRSNSL